MSPRLEPPQRELLTLLAKQHRATPPGVAPRFTLLRYDGGAALQNPTQTDATEVNEADLLILERAGLILIQRPNNDVSLITVLPEGLGYVEQEAYEQLKRRITALQNTDSKQHTLFRQRLNDLWTIINQQPPLQAIITELQTNEPNAKEIATHLEHQHTPVTNKPERTRAAIATHVVAAYLNGPTSNEDPNNPTIPLRIALYNTNSQDTESGIAYIREELLHPLINHLKDAIGHDPEPPPALPQTVIDSMETVRSRMAKALRQVHGAFGNLTKPFGFADEVEPAVYAKQGLAALQELTDLNDANNHRLPQEAANLIDQFLRVIYQVRIDLGTAEDPHNPPNLRGTSRNTAHERLTSLQGIIDQIISIFRAIEERQAPAPAKPSSTPAAENVPPSQQETQPGPKPANNQPEFSIGNTIARRFRITRELGQGSFGTVYEATDLTLDERVALKVLRQVDSDAIKRFKEEVRLTRNIRHEGICRVNDIHQTENGKHFLSMELIEGTTLKEQLAATGRSTPERAITLGKKLASALKEAHRQGVIHRDLKPANIMLAERGPVITDFGLARPVERGDGSLDLAPENWSTWNASSGMIRPGGGDEAEAFYRGTDHRGVEGSRGRSCGAGFGSPDRGERGDGFPMALQVRRHGSERGETAAFSRRREPAVEAPGGGPDAGRAGAQGGPRKKMVTPADRRTAVGVMIDEVPISERRSCRLVGGRRSTVRYRSRRADFTELRLQLGELARTYPRWGYRMLCEIFRNAGTMVNHKRVYRIYKAEGLGLPRRRARKGPRPRQEKLEEAVRPNQRWSADFVSDTFASGRRFRCLTIVDQCTREAPDLVAGTSFSGARSDSSSRPAQRETRASRGARVGQRAGVHQRRHAPLGQAERCPSPFHRPGKADSECLHRKLQREVPGHLPRSSLVPGSRRRQSDDRGVAPHLRRSPTSQLPGRAASGGLRSKACRENRRCGNRGNRRAIPAVPTAPRRLLYSHRNWTRVGGKVTLTTNGKVLGTLDYMSPEQARGESPTRRVDVYAVGTILHEALTGTLPFPGSNAHQRIANKLTQDPPAPRTLNLEIPEELQRIILICLAREPNERYEDATALLRDLEELRPDTSSAAPQPPLGRRDTPQTTTQSQTRLNITFKRARGSDQSPVYRLEVEVIANDHIPEARLEVLWPRSISVTQAPGLTAERHEEHTRYTREVSEPLYPTEKRLLIDPNGTPRIDDFVDQTRARELESSEDSLRVRLLGSQGLIAETRLPVSALYDHDQSNHKSSTA